MRASLVLAAVLVLWPSAASAQQPAEQQKTHTVKKGDTLWDLAAAYLGDPFQWPEIYRVNREVVEDPHWIYPGEVLKIPGKLVVAEVVPDVSPDSEPPVPVEPAAEPAKEPQPSPVDPNSPTIFVQAGQARPTRPVRPAQSGATVTVNAVEPPATTVRFGEFLAAPFVDQKGGPRGAGRILERADLSPISAAEVQEIFQLHDRLVIGPPVGSVAPEGERYIAYALGPQLNDGQVIIPTGVVQVVRAPRRGEAALARIVRVFGEMRPSDKLMPYDSSALAVTARPQPVSDGRWAKVRWISSEPVMPSLQSYVVLNITSKEGVQLGDEFQLFEPRRSNAYSGGLAKPEIAVAHAQVVRVTPFATTVILTGQAQPKIDQRTMARVSAKMP